MDFPRKRQGMAGWHGFWAGIGLYESDTATMPRQPALDAVVAPLGGRLHETMPGQLTVDS